MARGYLGKISAIVSANTGDYVRKLNDSANQTKAFAQTIQRSLGRASAEAAKSFQSILTPVQQFERALQNASSLKLSFKGFAGAIRTVDELKARLSGLNEQDISIAVSTSGLKTVTELKNTLQGITQVDVDLLRNFGGLEQVRLLKAEIDSINEAGITTVVRADPRQLDALIAKFGQLDERKIDAIINVVGERQLDSAILKERQLFSIAEQLNKPLSAAVGQFSSLSAEVQAAFIPTLGLAQNAVDALGSRIQSGAEIGQEEFRKVEDQVKRTIAAIERIGSASALGGRIKTGNELEFRNPALRSSLNTAFDAQSGVDKLPDSVRAQTENFANLQVQLKASVNEAIRINAQIEAIEQNGGSAVRQYAALEGQLLNINTIAKTIRGQTEAFKEIQIDVDVRSLEQSGRQIQANLIDRLKAIDTAWDQSVRGLVGGVDEVDKRFLSLAARIERLALADRVDLDPAIAEYRNGVAAGEGYAQQLQRVLALEEQVGRIETRRPAAPSAPLGPAVPAGFGTVSEDIGRDITDSRRQLDILRGSIVSAKTELDKLPSGLRAQFIPAIQAAEREFLRLVRSPAATAEEIERAASEVERLAVQVSRVASAGRLPSFIDASQQAAVREYAGQLQAAQNVLLRISATTSGPAAAAYERLRAAQQRAIREGTTGFPAVAREIERLQRELAEAAAQTGRVSFGRAFREIRRGGDVARGGVDNLSLALNQAAFAVDDFFSSTGGLEFKLRAVSNNITQLAFILGNTTGLFIGLGAVIAGQAAVSLLKWANNGRTAEDATRALNDALAKQKSLVEELAQAFNSLGESIAKKAFSAPAQEAREFANQLEEIAKKQKEAREEDAVRFDPAVVRARSDQNVARRRIETAQDPETILDGQRQLEQAREREVAARNAVLARGADPRRAFDAIIRSIEDELSLFTQDEGPANVQIERARQLREQAERDRQGAVGAGGTEAITRSIAALQQERERLLASGSTQPEISRNVGAIDALIKSFELPLQEAADGLAVRLLESTNTAADQIRLSQQRLVEALSQGVPGATEIAGQLDTAAGSIDAVIQRITDAGEIRDPAARQQALDAARGDLTAGRQARDAARAAADRVRRDVAISPQQQAVQRAEQLRQGLVAGGLQGTGFAQELNRVLSQRQAIIDRVTQENLVGQDRQQAAASLAETDKQIAALVASTSALSRFTDALARATDEAARDVGDAQQRVDDARRNELRLRGDQLGGGREALDQAIAVRAAEGQALRLQQEAQQRIAAAAALGADAVRAAADAAAILAESNAAAARGRQLLQSPEQQAALSLDGQLRDAGQALNRAFAEELERIPGFIRQAAGIDLTDGLDLREIENAVRGGLIDDEAKRRVLAQINNIKENALAAAAPAFQALADARANARLQGPSRAALNVSDISTQQGAAELNRLLRGDDAAKDVNFVELKKQSGLQEKILGFIEEMKQKLGVAN